MIWPELSGQSLRKQRVLVYVHDDGSSRQLLASLENEFVCRVQTTAAFVMMNDILATTGAFG
jgi:hypothetical protein